MDIYAEWGPLDNLFDFQGTSFPTGTGSIKIVTTNSEDDSRDADSQGGRPSSKAGPNGGNIHGGNEHTSISNLPRPDTGASSSSSGKEFQRMDLDPIRPSSFGFHSFPVCKQPIRDWFLDNAETCLTDDRIATEFSRRLRHQHTAQRLLRDRDYSGIVSMDPVFSSPIDLAQTLEAYDQQILRGETPKYLHPVVYPHLGDDVKARNAETDKQIKMEGHEDEEASKSCKDMERELQ